MYDLQPTFLAGGIGKVFVTRTAVLLIDAGLGSLQVDSFLILQCLRVVLLKFSVGMRVLLHRFFRFLDVGCFEWLMNINHGSPFTTLPMTA